MSYNPSTASSSSTLVGSSYKGQQYYDAYYSTRSFSPKSAVSRHSQYAGSQGSSQTYVASPYSDSSPFWSVTALPPSSQYSSSPVAPSCSQLHPFLLSGSTGQNVCPKYVQVFSHVASKPSQHEIMFKLPPGIAPGVDTSRWIGSARASGSYGLSVEEVLVAVSHFFFHQLSRDEYHAMSHTVKPKATSAFHSRAAGDPNAHSKGMIRADALPGNLFFSGFTKSTDGSNAYELILIRAP
ncbi:hypothetical protein C8J56DRAFT_934344 [Mycena floridula]|nr:hypothetical protein C8J56DRAFT_934344 [Mycena floridula]